MPFSRIINSVCLVLVVLVIFIQAVNQPALAVIEAVEFDNPILLKRYQSLIAELRCLVCQNQNLADSDADLAKDLRRKTEEMLKAGQSDKAILAYMRERYGDFVLYRPPLNSSTSFLWIGPFLLLLIATISLIIMIKRKQRRALITNDDDNSKQQLKKIQDLLNKDHSDQNTSNQRK